MKRQVEVSIRVRSPIERVREVLVGDPGSAFSEWVTPEERCERSFHATLGVELGAGGVHHQVRVDVGDIADVDDVITLPVQWRATGDRFHLFPSFDGMIEATAEAIGSRLTLRGSYTVPLGALGRLGEDIAGRRLAHQSLCSIIEQVGRRVDLEAGRRADAADAAGDAVELRCCPSETFLG